MKFCTLASGSNGNAAFLSDSEVRILIDIGISNRALCAALESVGEQHEAVSAVFITHEHGDHVRGLEVWAKKHPECVYFASVGTARGITDANPQISDRIIAFKAGDCLEYKGFEIQTFKTPHDTDESVAYLFKKDHVKIMVVTDLGIVTDEIYDNMQGLDLLLVEANYDEKMLRYGKYPQMLKARIAGETGHLSNAECAKCVLHAAQSGCACVLLGHLSQENNTPRVAYETVHSALVNAGIIPGVDMQLHVAPRGKCGEPINISKEEICSQYK